jgi:hypothetical protein
MERGPLFCVSPAGARGSAQKAGRQELRQGVKSALAAGRKREKACISVFNKTLGRPKMIALHKEKRNTLSRTINFVNIPTQLGVRVCRDCVF